MDPPPAPNGTKTREFQRAALRAIGNIATVKFLLQFQARDINTL